MLEQRQRRVPERVLAQQRGPVLEQVLEQVLERLQQRLVRAAQWRHHNLRLL